MANTIRRYEADWLRVFATYLLFVFHGAKVFDVAPFYHIKNDTLVPSLDLFTYFIHLWHMPLLFALAGWSLCISLRVRGPENMIRERMRRLFVPLVFGIVVLCPIIKYYELRSGLNLSISGLETGFEFHESFLAYWPSFFSGLDRFTWAHLWFIAYLLTFTLLYRKRCIARLETAPSDAPRSPMHLYRPLIALVLIQTTLRLVWPGSLNLVWDWANFAYYSLYFLMGFEVGRNPAWERAIAGEWRRAGAIAVASCIAMVVYLMVVFGGNVSLDPANISLLDIVKLLPLLASTAVAGYCVIITLVGLALKTLRRGNRVISYLSESSLPVYVLHQVGIVVPGYYLLQFDLPVSIKLPLLLVISTSLTLAVYHWIVRPNAVLRFAFGMPAKPAALRFAVRARAATTLGILATVLLFASSAGADAGEATAVGLWWADNGSAQVEVHESDGALTGTIVWLRAPFGVDGQTMRDINHPDASRHDTPVVGLAMLSGFRRESRDAEIWTGGSVYDPGNGRTYQGTIRMDGEDRLLLRGFIGISLLGRTTTWIRVGSEESPPPEPLAARVAN
jgi:glucan biosynthesis protein C